MEETITRYIATITVGDEYHAEGEEHILTSWEVEAVQRTGLQLEVKKNNWGDVFYHIYPCTISARRPGGGLHIEHELQSSAGTVWLDKPFAKIRQIPAHAGAEI